jgi:hypothetical protein
MSIDSSDTSALGGPVNVLSESDEAMVGMLDTFFRCEEDIDDEAIQRAHAAIAHVSERAALFATRWSGLTNVCCKSVNMSVDQLKFKQKQNWDANQEKSRRQNATTVPASPAEHKEAVRNAPVDQRDGMQEQHVGSICAYLERAGVAFNLDMNQTELEALVAPRLPSPGWDKAKWANLMQGDGKCCDCGNPVCRHDPVYVSNEAVFFYRQKDGKQVPWHACYEQCNLTCARCCTGVFWGGWCD